MGARRSRSSPFGRGSTAGWVARLRQGAALLVAAVLLGCSGNSDKEPMLETVLAFGNSVQWLYADDVGLAWTDTVGVDPKLVFPRGGDTLEYVPLEHLGFRPHVVGGEVLINRTAATSSSVPAGPSILAVDRTTLAERTVVDAKDSYAFGLLGDQLYFTNCFHGLFRAPLSGGTSELVRKTGCGALEISGDKVLVQEEKAGGLPYPILSIAPDGSVVTIANGELLASDDNSAVVWMTGPECSTYCLYAVPSGGGEPTLLVKDRWLGAPAPHRGWLYYFEDRSTDTETVGDLQSVRMTGGAAQRLIGTRRNPGPLAVTDGAIYWAEGEYGARQVMKLRR
ncbi:MAG TPA: hypothetical protein PKA88_07690 [Polyangiaceae bacterium]|nr:hypothetical protein [Polyangiaceae bacterium]